MSKCTNNDLGGFLLLLGRLLRLSWEVGINVVGDHYQWKCNEDVVGEWCVGIIQPAVASHESDMKVG